MVNLDDGDQTTPEVPPARSCRAVYGQIDASLDTPSTPTVHWSSAARSKHPKTQKPCPRRGRVDLRGGSSKWVGRFGCTPVIKENYRRDRRGERPGRPRCWLDNLVGRTSCVSGELASAVLVLVSLARRVPAFAPCPKPTPFAGYDVLSIQYLPPVHPPGTQRVEGKREDVTF